MVQLWEVEPFATIKIPNIPCTLAYDIQSIYGCGESVCKIASCIERIGAFDEAFAGFVYLFEAAIARRDLNTIMLQDDTD